jgi:hypothetical protein
MVAACSSMMVLAGGASFVRSSLADERVVNVSRVRSGGSTDTKRWLAADRADVPRGAESGVRGRLRERRGATRKIMRRSRSINADPELLASVLRAVRSRHSRSHVAAVLLPDSELLQLVNFGIRILPILLRTGEASSPPAHCRARYTGLVSASVRS